MNSREHLRDQEGQDLVDERLYRGVSSTTLYFVFFQTPKFWMCLDDSGNTYHFKNRPQGLPDYAEMSPPGTFDPKKLTPIADVQAEIKGLRAQGGDEAKRKIRFLEKRAHLTPKYTGPSLEPPIPRGDPTKLPMRIGLKSLSPGLTMAETEGERQNFAAKFV